MRHAFIIAALVPMSVLPMALSGCSTTPKQAYVDHAWVRLGAVSGRPAAAYFTIHGGPEPRTLIAVTTDVAVNSEMHETIDKGGTAEMEALHDVSVPKDQTVVFAPAGRHVMLFDMNAGIKAGGSITLTFTFSNGERILKDAPVIGAGDPVPEKG